MGLSVTGWGFDLFSEAKVEAGAIPRRGLVYIGVFALLSASLAFAPWTWETLPATLGIALAAAEFIAWIAMVYTVSMLMVDGRASMVGLLRFGGTLLASVLPIAVSFGAMFLGGYLSNLLLALSGLILLVGSTILSFVLAGWPIMNALSSRLVGPLSAYRLTAGLRWPLILATFVLGGLNRLWPEVEANASFWTITGFAAAEAALIFIQNIAALALSVAVWRRMEAKRQAAEG